MSRKDRKEGSLNYINLTFALLALALVSIAGILPYWTTFPSDGGLSWIQRQWGLLKISGKYTNLILTGADITWIQVRDSVCGASAAYNGGGGPSMVGAASALGNGLTGASCPPMCKQHIMDRCRLYNTSVYVNFAVLGLLVFGALTSLVGASMPLIGKERKKDKTTWMLVDLLGFLLAMGGVVAYYFWFNSMFTTLRQTSWFQKNSVGFCFFIAGFGALMLLVPVVVQGYKVSLIPKKPVPGQLLTTGASPAFLMPTAI